MILQKYDVFLSRTKVALASFWFDEKYSVIRFCGAKEIDPDMSTEILKDTPHYYVIGVTLTKVE